MPPTFLDGEGQDLYFNIEGEFVSFSELVEEHLARGEQFRLEIKPLYYLFPGEGWFESSVGNFVYKEQIYVKTESGFEFLDPHGRIGLDIDVRGIGADGVMLAGGKGADRLVGSNGNDYLDSNGGRDTIHGKGGDDSIDGFVGAQRLHGGSGDDVFQAYGGADTMTGGAGSDEFIIYDAHGSKARITDFNPERDTVRYDVFSAGSTYKIVEKADGCKIIFKPPEGYQYDFHPTVFLEGIEERDLKDDNIQLGWGW